MKSINTKKGQGSLNAQFIFDIGKLCISIIVVIFTLYLISELIIFFWPPPSIELMGPANAINTLQIGLDKFSQLEKNNIVILPFISQFSSDAFSATMSEISSGSSFKLGGLVEVKSEFCVAGISKKKCIPVESNGKKIAVYEHQQYTQFILGSTKIPSSQLKYIVIQEVGNLYAVYIIDDQSSNSIDYWKNLQKVQVVTPSSQITPTANGVNTQTGVVVARDPFAPVVEDVLPREGSKVEINRPWQMDDTYVYSNSVWVITARFTVKNPLSHDDFMAALRQTLAFNPNLELTFIAAENAPYVGIKDVDALQDRIDRDSAGVI